MLSRSSSGRSSQVGSMRKLAESPGVVTQVQKKQTAAAAVSSQACGQSRSKHGGFFSSEKKKQRSGSKSLLRHGSQPQFVGKFFADEEQEEQPRLPAKFDGDAHVAGIYCLAWSARSNVLATGCKDGSVGLWRGAASIGVVREAHGKWVRSVAWNSPGTVLASAGMDGAVKFWRSNGGRRAPGLCLSAVDRLRCDDDDEEFYVLSVCFLAAEAFGTESVCVGSSSPRLAVWSVLGRCCLVVVAAHTEPARCLKPSPDGLSIASGSDDKTVRVWHLPRNESRCALRGFGSHVSALAWSPDSTLLAAASADSSVRVINASSSHDFGSVVWVWRGESEGVASGVNDVGFSPNGLFLAVATAQKIRIFNGVSDRRLGSFVALVDAKEIRYDLAFSADSRALVYATSVVHVISNKSKRPGSSPSSSGKQQRLQTPEPTSTMRPTSIRQIHAARLSASWNSRASLKSRLSTHVEARKHAPAVPVPLTWISLDNLDDNAPLQRSRPGTADTSG